MILIIMTVAMARLWGDRDDGLDVMHAIIMISFQRLSSS